MRFSFEVGDTERHQITFSWEKFLGVAKIYVDDQMVLKSRPIAWDELSQVSGLGGLVGQIRYLADVANGQPNLKMIRGWTIEVGEVEKHRVWIEKERPLFLAALRPHRYRVFVDTSLVGEYRG